MGGPGAGIGAWILLKQKDIEFHIDCPFVKH